MPKIGLRIVKTAVAVLVCLLLDVALLGLFPDLGPQVYSPFFAGLAAIYSISNDRDYSFKLAKVRSLGSIIGSVVAVLVVLLFELALLPLLAPQHVLWGLTIKYILVSFSLVLLIYSTILFKQTDATFVASLTYLSVTVGNRTNLATPLFALNRTLSTVIGVLLALLINFLVIRRHKNKNILFVMGIDNVFVEQLEVISTQSKFALNELLYNNCNITLATIHTPTSVLKIFDDVNFVLPHIVMNGAAIYDANENSFSNIVGIEDEIRQKLERLFQQNALHYFTYIIVNDVLTIYYDRLANQGEQLYFEHRKNTHFKSFAKGTAPQENAVVFYIAIAEKQKIEMVAAAIKEAQLEDYLDIVIYPFKEIEGYYHLKIHNQKATRLQGLDRLQASANAQYLIAIGNNDYDIPMLKRANYAICFEDAVANVKAVCDIIIPKKQTNEALRLINKIYYHRQPILYLEKLKEKQQKNK